MAAFARSTLTAPGRREVLLPAAIAGFVGAVLFGALQKFGDVGLVAPLALVVGVLLVARPTFTTFLAIGIVIVCEGPSFQLLPTDFVYTALVKGVTAIDVLFAAAVLGTTIRLLLQRRSLTLPPPLLGIPLTLLTAAVLSGFIVGRSAGTPPFAMLLAAHNFAYVIIVPMLLLNLELDSAALRRILFGAGAIAVFKALAGLLALASGNGTTLGGTETAVMTYYEPTANWLMMVVFLWLIAASVRAGRPPLWLLTAAPVVLAALLLSYRRSFWIGLAIGLIVVIALGLSPTGRRALVPTVALLGVVVWLVGSFAIPGDSPVVRRAVSLQPSSVTASAQDRYRLDERANVWANVREHPFTGLGLGVAWSATERPLPLDLGRQYAHFAALYWWMKLGILGAIAYVSTLLAALVLSWRLWRRAAQPYVRAAGLASLAAVVGLIPIEMTASFTGVETRFTILFGTQLGLLAILSSRAVKRDQ